MKPMLKINNIYKSFGSKKVLKGISLDVAPGDIVGLVGLSGCGKSTLLKILVGYHTADKGSVIFRAKDITQNFKGIKKTVGYTTQDNTFYEKLTVYENMQYYASLYGVKRKDIQDHIYNILKSVNLYDARDKLAEDISGGMKRRLDFAISIIHDPELIILDEPTAGLDPLLIDQFWNVVQSVVKKGNKAVIMSSHILSEIEDHCNKVALMKNGKIEELWKISKGFDLDKKFRDVLK